MTTSIGSALGHLGARGATSAFAVRERDDGPRDFARDFERAIVDTWFAGGPIARLQPTTTPDPVAAEPSTAAAPPTHGRSSAASAASERTPRRERHHARADPAADAVGTPSVAEATARRVAPQDAPRPTPGPAMPSPATACLRAAVSAFPVSASVEAPLSPPVARSTPALEIATTGPVSPRADGPVAAAPPLGEGEPAAPFRPPAPEVRADASAPPIRLHVEADGAGSAQVWLGVDAAARAAGDAVVQQVRDALSRSGVRLRGVVVNGAALDETTPSPIHPSTRSREDS